MAKERPILFSTPMVQAILQGRKTQTRRVVKEPFQGWMNKAQNPDWWVEIPEQCPYGQPGDVLWVRESFSKIYENGFEYKAGFTDEPIKWKPSIHMPKAAARIWLRITDVRVERLLAISQYDAIAEGVPNYTNDDGSKLLPADSFLVLWHSIHGKGSVEANPWVWVLSFEVLSTTGRKEATNG